MVNEMSYTTVSLVVDSWEQVRRLPDYEVKIGTVLFQQLFDVEPAVKSIFGFDEWSGKDYQKNSKFIRHSRYFIQMIDKALGMLGPDLELLTEILIELGAKHVHYGVRPEYFPSMGRALLYSIGMTLGEAFTQTTKDAWVEVYGAMSYDMIRAKVVRGKD